MEIEELLRTRSPEEIAEACRMWIDLWESDKLEIRTPAEQRFAGFVYGMAVTCEAQEHASRTPADGAPV